MFNIKKIISKLALLGCIALSMAGCHRHEGRGANTIVVGTIAGPETQLMEVAKQVALTKYDLNVQIVTFTDYNQPNQALADGDIDANMFQHKPYLDSQIAGNHYDIVAVAKTFVYPVGIYSQKIKSLTDLPKGAIVSIPNDPTNEGRALLLLQKAGVIKLKAGVTFMAMPADIIENNHHVILKELDAADLTRSLPDVTISVINTNYATLAGLSPHKNGLFVEGSDSLYANLIVVRTADQENVKINELIQSFQSPEVVEAAKKIFKDGAIAAWKASL